MSSEATPLVGIIMGSKSDMPAMGACTEQLDAFGVPYELVIASAHRAPAKVHEWASLLSMVQMPSGVPVACVAIGGSKNAAIYATQILGATLPEYRDKIIAMKDEMANA